MFSTLRKFFGSRAENAVDPRNQPRASAPAQVLPANPQRAVRSEPPQQRPIVPPANTPNTLAIPLRSVLDRLPPELAMRVRQVEVGDTHISIPMQKVLSQISNGSVKISYYELRQTAPPGTFTSEMDRDRSLVEIPLHEVLARLNPALLSRRPVQKQVNVPAEVVGPFSGQAQVMFTTAPLKAPAAPMQPSARVQTPVAQPPPVAPKAPPAPVTPLSAMRPAAPVQPFPQPTPASRIQTAPPFAYTQPAQPVQPAQPMVSRVQPVAPAPAPAPVPPPAPPVARVRTAAQKSDTEQVFFRKVTPIAPVAPPLQPVYSPIAPEPVPAPVAQAPVIPMPELPRVAAPAVPITPIAPEVEQEPAPIRFSAPAFTQEFTSISAPAPAPEPEPEPAPAPVSTEPAETRFLTVALAELYINWPEPVQQEIELYNLGGSVVALPFGLIETAIRQGKVELEWRTLRPWIQPAVHLPISSFDGMLLELPLRILTPLFLAELRTSKPQKRVVVDENIPDLFSNGSRPVAPAPAHAPAPVRAPAPIPANIPAVVVAATPANAPRPAQPVAKAADTNYFARKGAETQPEEAAPPVKKGPSPGTAFLIRYATPNEIVSKAAALDGVDGALIALPDGLLVASHIPPSMNADTVAAFLPQIFGRVSQCTKELRLGDLNNLNFTVGTIPWKIFKVGAIYFAAFGRAGEPLPTAQLAGIAAELDRKAK